MATINYQKVPQGKHKWAHHRAELCKSVPSGAARRGRVSVITTRGRGGRGRRLDIHAVEGLVGRNLEPRRPWRGDRILNLARGGCDDGERERNTRQAVATRRQGDGPIKKSIKEELFSCQTYLGMGYAAILTVWGGSLEPPGRTEALVGRRCDASHPFDAFCLRLASGRTFDRDISRQWSRRGGSLAIGGTFDRVTSRQRSRRGGSLAIGGIFDRVTSRQWPRRDGSLANICIRHVRSAGGRALRRRRGGCWLSRSDYLR